MTAFTTLESELIDRIRAQDQELAALKKLVVIHLKALIIDINVYGNSLPCKLDEPMDQVRTELRRIIRDVLQEPNCH